MYEQIFFLSLALIISGVGFKTNISTMKSYIKKEIQEETFHNFLYGNKYWSFYCNAFMWLFRRRNVGWAYGFEAAGIGMLLGLIIFLGGQRYLEGLAEPPSNEYR